MKKMLAILGSPHDRGSSAAMLDCAVRAAKASGWEVTVVHLYEKKLAFCTGCRTCISTGQCVIKDDIQEISALLKGCDRVVLAAPTYWAGVPAPVKNMFDRLLGTAMGEARAIPRPRLSRSQEYLLLTACNTPFPFSWICGQSRGALRAMDEFFRTSGMKRLGRMAFAGAGGRPQLPAGITRKIGRFWK